MRRSVCLLRFGPYRLEVESLSIRPVIPLGLVFDLSLSKTYSPLRSSFLLPWCRMSTDTVGDDDVYDDDMNDN